MEDLVTIEAAQNDLLACAVYLAGKISGNETQAEAIKPIVLQYLKKGDVDNAAHLADSVNDSYMRNQLLVAVIGKCIEVDDDEYAFQLIEAIDEYGMQATAKEAIALKEAAKGDFDKAFEIANMLEHSAIAFAGIAVQQVKKGFENEALQTLKAINFHKSRVEALQAMAVYFQEIEQTEKAVEYFEKALQEAELIEFDEDKVRVLFEIANHFIEAGEKDKALATFTKVVAGIKQLNGHHKDGLFSSAAIGLLKAGSLEIADRTLDEVTDKTQIANCLVGFSQVFEKEGERDEALETLEEGYAILKSEQESEIRDSKSRFQLFGAIAVQFARLEKFERALEIAHENPVEFQRNAALTNIAQVSILNGDEASALQSVKGIESDSQRMSAFVAMSDAQNQAENKPKAIELLDEAAVLVETIPQYIARGETQNELSNRYGFYGKIEKAREIASESLQTVEEILGDNNRSIALTDLSVIYDKYDFSLSDKDKEVLALLVKKSNW